LDVLKEEISLLESLSPRLAAVADLVPFGSVVADIGTDHAYLPLSLMQKGHIPYAIATDMREGPLQNAAKSANTYGFADKISLRLGNGLDPVGVDEASCIVMAGMGGETIASILENGTVPNDARAFILQPMTKFEVLRRFLAQNGFGITSWRLAREGRHIYECWAVSVSRHAPVETDELYLHVGRKTPETESLYTFYIRDRLFKLRKKRNGLARSAAGGGELKIKLSSLIERIEKEVLA
jgi:tRNA (adenine22-N1)-methyltransferase